MGDEEERKEEEEVPGGGSLVLYPQGGSWSGAEYWILRGSTSGDRHAPGHACEVSTVRWSVIIRRCFPIETTSQFAMTIDQYSTRAFQLALVTRHLDLMKTGIIYSSKIIIHHRCSWLATLSLLICCSVFYCRQTFQFGLLSVNGIWQCCPSFCSFPTSQRKDFICRRGKEVHKYGVIFQVQID